MKRRSAILGCASSLSAPIFAKEPRLDVVAPTIDPISALILRSPPRKPWQSSGGQLSDTKLAIHTNFPSIIERNLARMKDARLQMAIDGLSPVELRVLAQLYTNACIDAAWSPRLLPLFATRLNGRRLARLSAHFGFGPTYGAVIQYAPGKAQEFLQYSDVNSRPPVAGFTQVAMHREAAFESGPVHSDYQDIPRPHLQRTGAFGDFLNFTPYEIYLSFRTAPVGALGVTGAIWESTAILSRGIGLAWTGGFAVGSAIAPIIQQQAPGLWDAIGETINTIIENLHNGLESPSQNTRGEAQRDSMESMGLEALMPIMGESRGDFDVAADFSDVYFGGGGGGWDHCWTDDMCMDQI